MLKWWSIVLVQGLSLLSLSAWAEDAKPDADKPPQVSVEEQSFANAMTTAGLSIVALKNCVDAAVQASRSETDQAVMYSKSVKDQIARLEATVKNLTEQLNAAGKSEEKK